jgi:hypothetical protein
MQKEDLNNLVTIADLNNYYDKIISELRRLFERDKPEFYSPKQFSEKTGMPYTTVIHYCKTRQLKARQEYRGSKWLIYASEIDRLKEEADTNHFDR